MNDPLPPNIQIYNQQRPESGTATALAVVSLIFGTIGLFGSFIPCFGVLAIWLAVPASLCGGAAFGVARSKGSSIAFPVVAFVISLLGVIISCLQIMVFAGAGLAGGHVTVNGSSWPTQSPAQVDDSPLPMLSPAATATPSSPAASPSPHGQ